jgi:ribonuclease P protein component
VVNRALRLREEAEVREARARGKAYADGPLVARVLANDTEQNRYAVVAGKRVGKAVQRNRCKRLVREAIRKLHPRLIPGYDVVIIVRGTVEELTGLDVALGSLERIATKAKLIRPDEKDVSVVEPGQASTVTE